MQLYDLENIFFIRMNYYQKELHDIRYTLFVIHIIRKGNQIDIGAYIISYHSTTKTLLIHLEVLY